jgi:hypothetical protein
MGKKILDGRKLREERERYLLLQHKYDHRITLVKYAKEAMDIGDFGNAIAKYTDYLNIMAEVKQVKDYYALLPSHFDPKKDLTEMLMLSHVFFEMARVYDAIPKYAADSVRCIDQFINFSINQPYQVVNSEMLRKFIKKSVFKNPDPFKAAYQQIFVQSKKCYVVTFCYGPEHTITEEFRRLKDFLLDYGPGQEFVRIYYLLSSYAVERWERNQVMHAFAKLFLRPFLLLFSKLVLKFILK